MRSIFAKSYRVAAICGLFLLPFQLWAQFPGEHPWREVTYRFEKQSNPPEEIHTVIIKLSKKRTVVRVAAGGSDPDGPGKWQTTLMPVSQVASREHFDIAINGDFFSIPRGKDAEGEAAQKLFEHGTPSLVTGAAMTDGRAWSQSEKPHPILEVTGKGRLKMVEASVAPADASQVIAGKDFLVHDGKALFTDAGVSYKLGEFRNINPRTAIGINKKGDKLYLLVVDGRSELSKGMTYGQLAAEMVKLGCYAAINLDGGGSSTLVMHEPSSGEYKVLNHPSDKKERSVANVLGVTIRNDAR